MKTQLLLLLFCTTTFAGQAQSLNEFDSNGKKHGKWTVYLDALWNEVKDSTQAVYYRYTYFDHGTNTIPISPKGMKPKAKAETPEGEKLVLGKPIPLNGTYKWRDKKGTVGLEYEVKMGEMVAYKEYWKDGNPRLEIDYTQQFMEQPNTYQMWFTDKKGNRTHYFHQKVDKMGWIDYQAPYEPDSITTTELKANGDTIFVSETWYRNGKIDNEVEKIYFKDKGRGFFDGMYHGKYLAWYGNGNKEHEGVFRFGEPMDGWKSWDADGTLREKKK